MPLECDDFVFRKVNWPLPLRRGGWVGFRLTAKLSLSVTKPNCRRSLRLCLFMSYICDLFFIFSLNFIAINNIIVLGDINIDIEISNCDKDEKSESASGCCLAFAYFAQSQSTFAYKSVPYKKVCLSSIKIFHYISSVNIFQFN